MAFDIASKLTVAMGATGAEKLKGQITDVARGVDRITDVTGAAQRAWAGLLGGLTAAAFTGWIKSSIGAADALDEMSSRIGIGAKELSKLELAYRMGGLATEDMQTSLGKLSKEIADGNKAFDTLGVKTRNADGTLRGSIEVLHDTADAFAGVREGTAKTALAIDLFGKKGPEMLGVLADGSEGLREMALQAERLGLVIDDDTAKSAGQFNDQVEMLGLGISGVGRKVAAELLPALTSVSAAMLETATQGDFATKVATGLGLAFRTLYTGGVLLAEVFNTVGKVLGMAGAQVAAILRGDVKGWFAVAREGMADIKSGWSSSAAAIARAWDDTGNSAVQNTARAVKALRDLKPPTKEAEAAANAYAKALDDDWQALVKATAAGNAYRDALEDKNAVLELEIALGRDLTDSERQLLELDAKLADGTLVMFDATEQLTRAEIARNQVLRETKSWLNETRSANDATFQSMLERTAGLDQEIAAQQLANQQIGLSAEALAYLEAAKIRDMAATADRNAAIAKSWDWEGRVSAEYERQAVKLRELADLKEAGVHIRAARESATEWKKTTDSIENGLTDALMRAFERGEGFGEAFKSTLINAFKTMVLEPGVRWAVSSAGSYISSALGISSGGGSLAGAASNLSSLYSLGGTAGASIFGSSAAYGAAIGTTNIGAGSQAAMLAAQTGEFGFAGAAATSSAAAGAGSGAASWVSSLGPYAAIALVLLAMFGDFSKFSLGTVAEGSFDPAGKIKPDEFNVGNWGNNPEKMRGGLLTGAVDQYGNAISSTAEFFGGTVGAGLGLSIGTDLDRDNETAAIIRLLRDGQTIAGTQTGSGAFGAGKSTPIWDDDALQIIGQSIMPGEAAKKLSQEDIAKWFGTQLPVVIVQALQESNLPERFATFFDDVQAGMLTPEKAQAMLDLATSVQALTDAFAPLGGVFETFGDISVAAFQQIADASGGFDALNASVGGYFNNFYTEAEQLAMRTDQLAQAFADAGLEMPKTREEFRALVESLDDMSTTADQEAFASLMKLQGAFASLVPWAEQAADSVDELAEAAARAAYPGGAITGLGQLSSASSAAQEAAQWSKLQQDFAAATTTAGNPWAAYISERGGTLPDVQMGGLFNSFAMQWQAAQEAGDIGAMMAGGGNGSGLISDGWAGDQAERDEAKRLQQQQITTMEKLIEQLAGLRQGLLDYTDRLLMSEYSPLSLEQQYQRGKEMFDEMVARALAGDTTAAGLVDDRADDLLRLSRGRNASGSAFVMDVTGIISALEGVEKRMAAVEANTAAQVKVAQGVGDATTSQLAEANRLASDMAINAVFERQANG